MFAFAACEKNPPVEENPDGDGIQTEQQTDPFNGHEYVDLGLPSGTLWATCNIGATKPEEYGNYYAWGEVEPKEYYDWSNEGEYKWGVYDSSASLDYGMTKYNTTDGKTVLDLEDDVAHVNWGGDWRMPTMAEIEELLNEEYCTWTWTTLNGVNGYEVTSKTNSNSIFFPATGCRRGSSFDLGGTAGGCWSSSPKMGTPRCAYFLNYDSDYYGLGFNLSRCDGISVRAVCSPKK